MTKEQWIDQNIDSICEAYLRCAEWSSHHHLTEEPIDKLNLPFAKSAETRAYEDCKALLDACEYDDLLKCEQEDIVKRWGIGHIGHDFWLTRNRHGAGFWDGDYESELGDRLDKISKTFSEIYVMVSGNNRYLVFESA
jgi:hypothetical protein